MDSPVRRLLSLARLLAAGSLACAATAHAAPDLTPTKSHAGSFTVGSNGTYSIVVRNVGTTSSLGATTVVDTLPAGLSYVAGNGFGWSFSTSGQVVTAVKPGLIAAGDTAGFTLTVAVGVAARPQVVNTAVVSTLGDIDAANDRAVDSTAVTAVDLRLDKDHTGVFRDGSPATYTFQVTNLGDAPTFGVITVLDTLPAGLTFLSGGGGGWTCSASGQIVTCTNPGPIAPSDSSGFTIDVIVGPAAVNGVQNHATVYTAGDIDPGNDSDSDPTTVLGVPDLSIDKSHTGNFVVTTDENYDLLVLNEGTAATFAATTILDTLPNGLAFVSGSGAGWSFSASGQIVTGTHAGFLGVGDTSLAVITVNVGFSALPSVTNRAGVSTAGDPNPANDQDSDSTGVVAGPDLTIQKSHVGNFTVGVNGVYTLTITNIGSAATAGTITVSDLLPNGLTYVSATGPGWSADTLGQVVTCTNPASINPGQSRTITLTVGVNASAVPSVTNIATVTVAGDVDPGDNSDADPTNVTPVNLALTKSHTGNFVAGTNGTYDFQVRNIGVGPTTGAITVLDTLPAGIGFVSGAGTAWSFSASGSIVTATNPGPIAAGATTTFTLTVSVGGAAAPGVTNRATLYNSSDATPANNRASDPTTVLAADLGLAKRHSGVFNVGVNATYTLTATNVGTTGTVSTITVLDTLPAGLTFVSGSGPGWTVNPSGQIVTCTRVGAIAPGDSGVIVITVVAGQSAVPGVVNHAHVSTAGDPNAANDHAADPTTVSGEPDLAVDKSHSGNFVVASTGTYTIAVTNVGSAATIGVITLVDTLPAGLTYVSSAGAGWSVSVSGQVVTATNPGPLAVSQSSSMTITVSVGAAALPSVTNIARVSTTGDPDNSNDFDSDPTVVTAVLDVSISKSHAGYFNVGSNGTYNFQVDNVGTISTTGGVTVTDTLPNGLGFVSGAGAGWTFSVSGQVVTATHAALMAAGSSSGFSVSVTVGVAAVPNVTNAAHAATPGDGNPGNDAASDFTVVNATLDLMIAKSHVGNFTAGSNGTYTITVTDVGTAPNTGAITVVDTLPAGLTFVSATGAGWSFSTNGPVVGAVNLGTLNPGESASFTLVVAVGATAVPGVTNNAQVSTPGDGNPANDVASDPTVVDPEPTPDLAIAKSHSGSFAVGIGGTYDIAVSNLGTAATSGAITVTDTLPVGLTYVSGAGAGWSFGVTGQVVTAVRLSSLNPAGSSAFSLTVSVAPAALPSVTNTAQVTTSNDSNPANDTASDVTAIDSADLAITKSHGGSFVVGINGTYTIMVSNVGSASSAGAITVTDTLPAGLTYVSASGPGWSFGVSGQVVTAVNAGPITAGGASSFTLTVAVDPTAVPGVTNKARVANPNDPNPANDVADDVTTVDSNPVPDLAIAKTHAGNFTVGTNGTYSITVSNVGSAATSGAITVTDTLPVGLTFVSGSGPGWTFSASGQVVTAVNLGPLAVGGSTSFTLIVAVGSAAVPGVTNSATVSTPGDPGDGSDQDPTVVNPSSSGPDLAIDKSHAGPFVVGQNGTYTITVTNVGSVATTGAITVTDTLPAGLTYVSASGSGWTFSVSGQIVTAVYTAPLAPAASTSFTLTVAVGAAAMPGVTNSATASTPGDPGDGSDQDPTAVGMTGALLLTKSASRGVVEIADFVDYTLRIRNPGVDSVSNVVAEDALPAGFSFLPGTARLDGTGAADPAGANGPRLSFAVGTVPAGGERVVSYRLRVGAAAPFGDGTNRAQASSLTDGVSSNLASATVKFSDGPFTDRGTIFGKVYLDRDCFSDPRQNRGDLGVPGVRILLEDGTWTVTDVEGKYHFYGLSPRTHVVRVDLATLPPGSPLVAVDHRSASDPVTRFIDLKATEFHRADFVIGSRSSAVLQSVLDRRAGGEVTGPIFERPSRADSSAGRVPMLTGKTLRSLLAHGVLEGRVDLHSLKGLGAIAARTGFEDPMRDFRMSAADGRGQAAARTALYLNGRVKGDYLVTLALDSEREAHERLFRDIQPGAFYPVYGDGSLKSYDAASAGRLYMRVERNQSYLLYGDYRTASDDPARLLGNYHRSLNGLQEHYVTGALTLNGFGSQGRSRQVVDELPARGISGPYLLSRADGLFNSETVEILTRDRNQPSVVLERRVLQRFVDYQIEPSTGHLLLTRPIPSVDSALNPLSIRVNYEVEQGDTYPLYGIDGTVKLFGGLQVGGSAVRNEDPIDPRRLYGSHATLALGTGTSLNAELARSDSAGASEANAGRLELSHRSGRFEARAFGSWVERGFLNESSPFVPGRDELGLHAGAALDSLTRVRFAAIHTEDRTTDGRRDGIEGDVERRLTPGLTANLGLRHADETAAPASPTSMGATPNGFTSVRGRLSAAVPQMRGLRLSGEHEQDVSNPDRYRSLLGADWRFSNRAGAYARQEWISSFAGPYALQTDRLLSTTVFGLDATSDGGARSFGEYRARDAFSGREAEAAMGLRNRWTVRPGLRLDASFERVTPIRGGGASEASAVTGAVEFTTDPTWKATARAEFRTSPAGDDFLGSLGWARKLTRDLSLLGRGLWNDLGSADRSDGRAQLGLAYRQTDRNRWNGLARYEYRFERETAIPAAGFWRDYHVLSTDWNHQPRTAITLSGHLAGKFGIDRSLGLASSQRAYAVGMRALVDVTDRWDVGAVGSSLFLGGVTSHREGFGLEMGRMVAANLRAAAGYNLLGWHDDVLGQSRHTDHGVYLSIGFKFDEDLFGLRAPVPQAPPAQPKVPPIVEQVDSDHRSNEP